MPLARVGDRWAWDLLEVCDDPAVLDRGGQWVVAIPFAGAPVLARFGSHGSVPPSGSVGRWQGPAVGAWYTSMAESAYIAAVERTRQVIAEGGVYQANVCRVLAAPLLGQDIDVAGLDALLRAGNPAPYAGMLRLPEHDVAIASASPELFLRIESVDGDRAVTSGPIKGTGRTRGDLSEKDAAENVMIVDLVRNDLSRICRTGSVHVPDLLVVEEHPGLVHLVSYVRGMLHDDAAWSDILESAFPPGSVTGAPKRAALALIDQLEPVPREFYCGAFGWIDADTGAAELAVAIRTFWLRDGQLRFGTGAGITWGSDAMAEWRETELKAERLVGVAAGAWQGGLP
jgi:para-aminobenzoate synthetase component 1